MKEVAIIGHFAYGLDYCDGQTVKTRMLARALGEHYGAAVAAIDTHGGKKNLLKAPFWVLSALKKSRRVLMLPAQNGLRVFAPLLYFLRKLFPGKKLYYAVVGGWLPAVLKEKKFLAQCLRDFDGIYVETKTMEKALRSLGFFNVSVLPNCKNLQIVSPKEMPRKEEPPYPLCTFSRVMWEKGIAEAVCAVQFLNDHLGKTMFTLDIYGPIDPEQREWFAELKKNFSPEIRYRGCADTEKSVAVLQNYFALLFPTKYYTEGVPGTLIDAYAAGVPVICSRWESFADVVDEGKTGLGYDFRKDMALYEVLAQVAENPHLILNMKEACLKKAEDYLPQRAMALLTADWKKGEF